jgi:hypothetical protein
VLALETEMDARVSLLLVLSRGNTGGYKVDLLTMDTVAFVSLSPI